MDKYRKGSYVRYGGDTIHLAPPFVSSTEAEIKTLLDALGESFASAERSDGGIHCRHPQREGGQGTGLTMV
ncbi:hypothetical protein [Roseateles chitosanitabidus]|uniref:hypothetical protein n=1 Tax=Roseateles chitosanitabidus TaxID=65048 RepID=UPI000835C0D2|nr:hypothetical protein [Roseateles chitosanitabidus]MBO9687104.1 hypothetical protein [Roseateles chitosanitabidus]